MEFERERERERERELVVTKGAWFMVQISEMYQGLSTRECLTKSQGHEYTQTQKGITDEVKAQH